MFFPPFNQEKSRFERKFVVSDMHYPAVEQAIRLHPAVFSEIFHQRFINNIYLDSNDLDFYYDNVSGKGSRKKVRIRWYGQMLEIINQPVLEFKIREGFVGNKLSFPLKPFALNNNFDFSTLQQIFEESKLPTWALETLRMLKPSLLNRYSRRYFLSFDKKFRLTIDADLSYYGIEPFDNDFLKKHSNNDIIVEIKYDFQNDPEAAFVTNRLPFRLTKSSKYVNGMEFLFPELV